MNSKPRLIEYFKGSLIGLVLATVFWPSLASAVMIDEPFIEAVSMRSDIWTARISPDGKRLALGFLSDELNSKKILINIRQDSKESEAGRNLLRYYVMDYTGKNKIEGFGSYEGRYSKNEIITSVFDYNARRVDYYIDRIDKKASRATALKRQNCKGVAAYAKKCNSKKFEDMPLLGQGSKRAFWLWRLSSWGDA